MNEEFKKPVGRIIPLGIALHIVAKKGDIGKIEKLIIYGADVDARDDTDKTPMHIAAKYNENSAVIEALFNADAEINAEDYDNRTPLHLAAKFNKNPAIIEMLIKLDAEVDAKDNENITPLQLAAEFNENREVIEALIKAGAAVNAKIIELAKLNENINQETINLLESKN